MIPFRSRLISAIHAAATKQGLDADTRRAMQKAITGKESCADMTEHELRRVLEHISPRKTGTDTSEASNASGDVSVPVLRRPVPARDKAALVRKVYALLGEADRPVKYAEGILRHMFKDEAPDALEWAKPEQLWKLVCALEYDKRRRAKGETPAP